MTNKKGKHGAIRAGKGPRLSRRLPASSSPHLSGRGSGAGSGTRLLAGVQQAKVDVDQETEVNRKQGRDEEGSPESSRQDVDLASARFGLKSPPSPGEPSVAPPSEGARMVDLSQAVPKFEREGPSQRQLNEMIRFLIRTAPHSTYRIAARRVLAELNRRVQWRR